MIDNMISSDRPINSLEADRYGLKDHFIPRLTRLALEWPTEDGLVIGLYGSWGIGKTSALNIFRDFVKKNEHYQNVRIASFNPWFYEDTGALVLSFFATVAAELGRDEEHPWKNAAKALKAMGAFLTVASKGVSLFGINVDATLIKDAMKAGTEALSGVGELSEGLSGLAELVNGGQKKLDEHRATVEQALRILGKSGGRIVVLVDDVDRLDKAELLSLLRLVRTVADLPYMTLVLAMDDERIRDILRDAVSEGYGKGYLDKIVQVPLHIPLPTREETISELVIHLEKTFKTRELDLPQELTPNSLWTPTELKLLVSLIRTPRDLARYLNGVRTLLLSGEDPDIHLTDAALIEALHIFHPDIYERVRRHKDFLTESPNRDTLHDTPESGNKREQIKTKRSNKLDAIVRGISNPINPRTEESARALLEQLFGDVTNPKLHRDTISDKANRRIRSPETFDNYFRCTPPPGVIRRSELEAYFAQIQDHAQNKNSDAIARILIEVFAERDGHATELLIQDLGYKLRPIGPEMMNSIGEGVLATHARLPSKLIVDIMRGVLDAILKFRFDNDREWTNERASALALQLLRPAVLSQLPLAHTVELLSWLKKSEVNEKESQKLCSDWIQRLDKNLREGDLLEEAAPEEMASIFHLARMLISELGNDSPVLQDKFSAHLTGYVLRCPDRLPQALYLVSIEPSDGIPFLMNSRYPRDAAVQSLQEVFGGHELLRPAYEACRANKLDAGRFTELLDDLGKLLSSTH